MTSTLYVDTCASESGASESGTSEEAQGPLDSQKGTCVSTPKMGDRISVPQLVREGSVKENVAFSPNCQGLDGVNNNVEATPLSEVRKEVKVIKREHEASCDNLADCESVRQVIPAGDEHFETQNRETSSAEKENSFVNGNSKSEIISKCKTLGSLEDKDEIITENWGGSADNVIAPIEGSFDIIHQSPDGPEQQIDNESKNKEFLRNEGEELDKINMISISADEFQSKCEQREMDEVCGSNTRQHSEIESKSPGCEQDPSQDVNCKPSLSKWDINTKVRCEDNINEEHSERLPFHTELNPYCAKLLTKEHSGGYSSDNSPVKKSPIFQRGLFPRIAIRDSGILAAKKLRKQLVIEKEKTEKREQQEGDKVCISTNDIKLKCAQVNLVKMNAHMLSKYNVNVPSLDLDGSVGRKLNSCDKKSSVNEKSNNLDHKIGCQVESAVSFEGQCKKNAKFSPGKEDTDQIMGSISVSIFDSKPSSEPLVKNIDNSRTNCDTPSLEKKSNLTGSDNTFHGAMEIKRGSKRRETAFAFTPIKKQKKLEMKVARVHILKIDDLILLKYGYDSHGLKIDEASIVPCSPAHSPSVGSFIGKSVKTIENHVLNSPDHLKHTASLASMKNSYKREMNNAIKKSTTTSHQRTNSQNARESLNIEDVPLSNRVVSKNTLSPEKIMAKTKCSVGKSGRNMKTPKVLMKRMNKESLSNDILSKKSYDLDPTKTNHKIKGSFKKAEKIPHTTVKRKENAASSGRVVINRSRSTTKPITKKKNSIKDKYNLKTAQVILKNINNSPLSRYILSEYLPTKRESSASVSKTKFHIQSTGIIQKQPLPKKQIIPQSKNCGSIDNQNDMANKASLCKGDAQDHSKENVCLNSDLKCLKGVRVNLYKLESKFQPKILSSKHVLSS